MPYLNEVSATGILDVINTVANFTDKIDDTASASDRRGRKANALTTTSIMRAGRDLIMSFPVLCDNTISPATATMVTKAIERMCVAQLQLLFSSAYVTGRSGQEVLKQWHTNMNQDMSMDDFLSVSDSITGYADRNGWHDGMFEAVLDKKAKEMGAQYISEMKFYPASSFSESAISDWTVDDRFGGRHISKTPTKYVSEEGNSYDYMNRASNYVASQTTGDNKESENNAIARGNLGLNQYKAEEQHRHNKRSEEETHDHNSASRMETKRHNRAGEHNDELDRMQRAYQFNKNRADKLSADRLNYFRTQLLDSDAKKANELVPSLIVVRFDVADPRNAKNASADDRIQEFIAGVKARLIPCSAYEIQENIADVNKNKVSLVNLIRATTKEISFAKDFVAAIDQAKIDAKKSSKLSKTSPIWRSLQARSTKSGLNRLRHNKANDASAITTLVLSNELVNVMKNDSNIDMTNPKVTRYVMESYNLMAVVLVDEQLEVAHFLLDGENQFQDYTFGALERDAGDGSVKKIINLISKINRG